MGVLVKIPIPFGTCTQGENEVMVAGNTVQNVLENLNEIHTGIMDKLCDQDGNLRRFVNLYLNERDVRLLNDLETNVSDGDIISIVSTITGG